MQDDLSKVLIAIVGFIGGLLVAGINLFVERRKYRIEMAKLMSAAEVEKARIEAYKELWKCLDGISTWHTPAEIVKNLPEVQKKLQDWYYRQGGGLLIGGSAENEESTKAAFFNARHIEKNSGAQKIWDSFHKLRRCLRRDLRIFETEEDEKREKQRVEQLLKK
jgi:hypothetical protein